MNEFFETPTFFIPPLGGYKKNSWGVSRLEVLNDE